MNKQELINSVKAWGAWCTDHNTGEKDRYVKINKVREFVEQLDEQPKITVPQFLDKYIQENKGECASDVLAKNGCMIVQMNWMMKLINGFMTTTEKKMTEDISLQFKLL